MCNSIGYLIKLLSLLQVGPLFSKYVHVQFEYTKPLTEYALYLDVSVYTSANTKRINNCSDML